MPRHTIQLSDWDEFVVKLEREDDERVVSTHITPDDRLEVLTVRRHPEVETR